MATATAGVRGHGARVSQGPDPFAHALRTAIEAKGLSLDRLALRLAHRGTPLSAATLSYWQSGRRRPERPNSLTALRALESVLGLPVDSLRCLLGPPRPRGRAAREARIPPVGTLWEPGSGPAAVLAMLDAEDDSNLARISHHDRCRVDSHGRTRTVRTRQVLRADADGIDRWILLHDHGGGSGVRPELSCLRNCSPGRTVLHAGHGVLAAELVFDHPLRSGETVLIEYEVSVPAPPAPTGPVTGGRHARRGRVPVRECVLEIDFPAETVPSWCGLYRRPLGDDGTSPTRRLRPTADGHVHAVGLDLPPCEFGIHWRYA